MLALQAIRDGDSAALRRVLVADPELLKGLFVAEGLMDEAIKLNRAVAVAVLLEAGVSANETNGNNGTFLMTAASHGYLEIAHLLLAAGADCNPLMTVPSDDDFSDDTAGRSAFYFALIQQHQPLIDLLDSVTDPEVRESAYETAAGSSRWLATGPLRHRPTIDLFRAARTSQLEPLAAAIEEGAFLNEVLQSWATDERLGSTPLSFAASAGRPDLVAALLAAGADPALKNHRGWTAADYAAFHGHDKISRQLRDLRQRTTTIGRPGEGNPAVQSSHKITQQLRPLINAVDEAGVRALIDQEAGWLVHHLSTFGPFVHLCAERNLVGILDAILRTGTSANPLDKANATPLMTAAQHGNLVIARMLLEAGADPNWVLILKQA